MHTEELNYDPRKRWGKKLIEEGFCIFPEQIIKNWSKTELDATDLAIVLNIAAYWWAVDRLPHPSLATISKNLNLSKRSVERRVKNMVDKGYIKKEKKVINNNTPIKIEWDLRGFIKKFEAM